MGTKIIKAVIFDLDGTLLDTVGDIAFHMNEMLQSNSFPQHPVESYKDFIGWGLKETTRRALPRDARTKENIETLSDTMIAAYTENPIIDSRPYPGIMNMIDTLTKLTIPMAILSNKDHDIVHKIVNEILGLDLFTQTIGSQMGKPRKPDPALALEICQDFGISPEHILYVGDTAIDIETAIGAGMIPGAVTWGFRSIEELQEAGATLFFDEPQDIISLIIGQE